MTAGRATTHRRRSLVRHAMLLLAIAGCAASPDAGLLAALRGAVTPEQHTILARQYRERAAEARSLATTHAVMAARYRDTSAQPGPDLEVAAHCDALVRLYQEVAERYDALAANEEALATGPRPASPRRPLDDRDY